MPGKTILELIKKLDPEKASKEIALAVKTLFPGGPRVAEFVVS
jgi:hypothetical protein